MEPETPARQAERQLRIRREVDDILRDAISKILRIPDIRHVDPFDRQISTVVSARETAVDKIAVCLFSVTRTNVPQ